MKCRHEFVWRMRQVEILGVETIVDVKGCCDCGAWLSLGPANDESEAVRVEIRAAGMLACHAVDDGCRCGDVERRLAPMGLEREARDLAMDVIWDERHDNAQRAEQEPRR